MEQGSLLARHKTEVTGIDPRDFVVQTVSTVTLPEGQIRNVVYLSIFAKRAGWRVVT